MRRIRFPAVSLASILSLVTLTSSAPLRADHDELDGPWSTIHGNTSGTASSADLTYGFPGGMAEEKWRLDIGPAGQDRMGGRTSFTFDKSGNLYWITSGNLIPGSIRLVSASPDGQIRWFGNDQGTLHQLGSAFSGTSAVVGAARVYALGDLAGSLYVAAYDKATGQRIWDKDLSPSTAPSGQMLTPILHDGKLYVVGVSGGAAKDIHQLDAETGDVNWSSTVDDVEITAVGQMAFVPDAFEEGVHGLYFNGDAAPPANIVYGIRLEPGQAAFGWKSQGGKVARSHVLYSSETGLLYTLTWSDYGAQVYVFDPATGFVASHANALNSGHGFYDVGAVDFDGTIIGGGFSGNIFRYTDTGGGAIVDEVLYKGGYPSAPFDIPFWGETRVIGQLLKDAEGNSILISGTNSFQCCGAHVFALDLTNQRLLWEHDTGNHNDHQFIFAGGPIQGPDGKIYFFERTPDATKVDLVAIGAAASEPKPSAGFVLIDATQAAVGPAGYPCIKAGDVIGLHGQCSVGKDLVYRYSVDPPEAAVITHTDEHSPDAQVVFRSSGQIPMTLEVENTGGIGSFTREICVQQAPPTCSFKVTDSAGGAIDNDDDLDGIPCLAEGQTAVVDASAAAGGDLQFEFTVTPLDGVFVDVGDDTNPVAHVTFNAAGSFTISVKVINASGEATCIGKKVCVKALPAPRNLRATDLIRKVSLIWDLVTDPTVLGYDMFRADTLDGSYQKINPALIAKDTDKYTDLNVTVGEDYFYRVRAVYAAGQASGDSNTERATVIGDIGPTFRRGDVDGNDMVELTDAVNLLGFLFLGDPQNLGCFDAADVDNTGIVELTDAIFELGWLYLGDPKDLPAPGPFSCGVDLADPVDDLEACTNACN